MSEGEYAKLKPLRERYVEIYVSHVKNLEYGDASQGFFLFLTMILINARHFLDFELVDEITYKLDMLNG